MKYRVLTRLPRNFPGTSMIGTSQGETEIPLDSAEWDPRGFRPAVSLLLVGKIERVTEKGQLV